MVLKNQVKNNWRCYEKIKEKTRYEMNSEVLMGVLMGVLDMHWSKWCSFDNLNLRHFMIIIATLYSSALRLPSSYHHWFLSIFYS